MGSVWSEFDYLDRIRKREDARHAELLLAISKLHVKRIDNHNAKLDVMNKYEPIDYLTGDELKHND